MSELYVQNTNKLVRENRLWSGKSKEKVREFCFTQIVDTLYKFRKIIGKNNFPYHFKKIIVRYKKIGYNINVMRQTACLVVNPI